MIKHSKNISFIRGSKESNGWMGNMCGFYAGTPLMIRYDGIMFNDSETLFQWLRFHDRATKQKIVDAKNGYKAKAVAKSAVASGVTMKYEPLSDEDVQSMILAVKVKLTSHSFLIDLLLKTHFNIIEDVSERRGGNNLFWGAAKVGNWWIGANVLGFIYEGFKTYLSSGISIDNEDIEAMIYTYLINIPHLKTVFI